LERLVTSKRSSCKKKKTGCRHPSIGEPVAGYNAENTVGKKKVKKELLETDK